jgi:hypothetical protein
MRRAHEFKLGHGLELDHGLKLGNRPFSHGC